MAMTEVTERISIESLRRYDPEPVEPLFNEFISWGASRIESDFGVRFDDRDGMIEAHHAAFRDEMPKICGPRGRLLLARAGGTPAGCVALKPVTDDVAEVKRMYVRPSARGLGIGRALLERLLADARALDYRVARLETLSFMTEAHALYRSLGFVDCEPFENFESASVGIPGLVMFMRLPLDPA